MTTAGVFCFPDVHRISNSADRAAFVPCLWSKRINNLMTLSGDLDPVLFWGRILGVVDPQYTPLQVQYSSLCLAVSHAPALLASSPLVQWN